MKAVCGPLTLSVKQKFQCPYPEVVAHDLDGGAATVSGTVPPHSDWQPEATVLTDAMKKKLAGLQRMQHHLEAGTKQTSRVMSLRWVDSRRLP